MLSVSREKKIREERERERRCVFRLEIDHFLEDDDDDDDTMRLEKSSIHLKTPLILSHPLSERIGKKVYLKMDCLQPTGSFKVRGVGHACQKALVGGYDKLVSSSGGNAGLATAHCGNVLGMDTTVCLPTTATSEVKHKIRKLGAKVVVEGSQWSESNAHAESLVAESGGKAVLIHPFDMPELWEGHATLVQELKEELPEKPSMIIACVGGGGLLMGILKGLKDCEWQDSVRVLACETCGADALAQSLQKRERVQLDSIRSVAKSLGADRIAEDILNECMSGQFSLDSMVVTDEEAVSSCFKFALDHNVLVEPACGASLAPLYFHSEKLKEHINDAVVVEVCGGGAFNSMETLLGYAKLLNLDLSGEKLAAA